MRTSVARSSRKPRRSATTSRGAGSGREAGAPRTVSAGRSAQLDDERSQDVVELNRLLNEDEVEVEAPGHGERQGHGITE
mmetsp:Transcript_91390/g.257598  ORF Transcript_91390/g.257598 Transcript_91390/m.257598 type:complete len:80 (-) Transcript_91390:383-622(-)